jgi:bacteriocin biosynthesis cyclodehydratase domain-containing protein
VTTAVQATAATVPAHPALAPWCRLVEDGRRVLIEHGGTVVTLEGRAATVLLPRLLPLLDGTRTTAQIADELGPATGPAVAKALSLLAGERLLVEGPIVSQDVDARTATATFAVGVTGRSTQAEAVSSLASARVAVLGSGATARELRRLHGRSGIRVDALPIDATPSDVALVVAAPEPTELEALDQLNDHALRRRQPWLQVLPYDGRFAVAGPLFLPDETACRTCWVMRRAACSGYEEDFELVDALPSRAASTAAIATLGASLAVVLAARWLATRDPTLPGRFYALETRTILRLRFEWVLRVPRCPMCGPERQAIPSPWFEVTR